jgi:hypothetical protein
VQEHFAGKVLEIAEIIFEGWIAKDGRFSSSFKRRWAKLSWGLAHPELELSCFDNLTQLNFCFSWGECGPDNFTEKNSVRFKLPGDAVSVAPLDQPLQGKQLPSPCSNFGFLLTIRGAFRANRAINIFCDSKADRDIWMCVFNMAACSRPPSRVFLNGEPEREHLIPGSFCTVIHQGYALNPNHWIEDDFFFKRALLQFEASKSTKQLLERREEEKRQFAKQEMERHQQIERQQQAMERKMESLGTLMQATFNRVQSLVRQNDVLQAQNAMLHAENRAQNAVIDQLISQINHQQLHAADSNAAIAASVKESQEQLRHAARRCDQCFSAEAAQ